MDGITIIHCSCDLALSDFQRGDVTIVSNLKNLTIAGLIGDGFISAVF